MMKNNSNIKKSKIRILTIEELYMINGGKQTSKDENEGDYTVKKGDTLSKIAQEHYPDASTKELSEKIKEIAKNSGIENPDLIRPGQKIVFDDKKGSEPSSSTAPSEPSRPQTDSSSTTSQEEYGDEPDYSERGDTEPDMTENTPNKQEKSYGKEKQVNGNGQHSSDEKNSNKQESSFGISLANIETKKGFFKSNDTLKGIKTINVTSQVNNIKERDNHALMLREQSEDILHAMIEGKNKNEYDPSENMLKGLDLQKTSNLISEFVKEHPGETIALTSISIIGAAVYFNEERVKEVADHAIKVISKYEIPVDDDHLSAATSISLGTSTSKSTDGTSFYVDARLKTRYSDSCTGSAANIQMTFDTSFKLGICPSGAGLFSLPGGTNKDFFIKPDLSIGVSVQY